MSPWIRKLVFGKLAKIVYVDVPASRTQEFIDEQKALLANELSTLEGNNDVNHTTNGVETENMTGIPNGKTVDVTYFPSALISKEEMEEATPKRQMNPTKKINDNINIYNITKKLKQLRANEERRHEESKKFLREDWKLVARVMDRVLFIIAVLIGVSSFAAIFLQAPRGRQMFVP